MKDFLVKPSTFRQIEFWGITTLFVFAVFILITHTLNIGGNNAIGAGVTSPFNYYFVSKLVRYVVLYCAFLVLNFKIVPALLRKEALWLNIVATVLMFVVIGLVYGMVSTFLKYALIAGSYEGEAPHIILFQQ